MIDKALLARLRPALERCRRRNIWLGAALGLTAAAIIAAVMLPSSHRLSAASDSAYAMARFFLLPGGLLLGLKGAFAGMKVRPNVRKLARRLERQFPDLDGRLTTALEQMPGESGDFSFLQEHLFAQTIHHSTQQDWQSAVPDASLRWARVAPVISLAAFVGLWALLPQPPAAPRQGTAPRSIAENGVEVTPGDTELEKGTALILLARFAEPVPSAAELVIGESAESERRLPLTRSLSDPVYGGAVPEVQTPFTYKVVWDGGSTRSYRVNVFEFPKLERSDITLTYPDYTKLPPKRIEDTRHTSAVEGTKLDLELALNKPVASAVLVPGKNAKDAAEVKEIALEVSPDKPVAVLRGHVPAQSARYELVLTDADGRRSKQSVPFSFDVVPNRVPEMKLASPRGDQTPSALQEIPFDGTVWDDFGVVACGLEVATPGGESVTVEFGKDVPAREKLAFQKLLSMEDLSAVPDQLFAWHTWADDIGPDGKVRRTKGDLFFAEVRAFEQIFRQGEGMESQQQQQQQDQQQQQQGQGGQAEQLAKLQKQIISATWKIQQRQDAAKKPEDIKVVRDSQEDAHSQAEQAAGEAGSSPATAALWQGALQNMQQALERLEKATEAPPELASALAPEQAAYQALLKLREREAQVSRQNRQQQQQQSQQGQSQGEQQQQQQLDQLDLAKNEDRYETQREAQAQQSAERREQMQVINRLKELAQRQGDVNEKLKELQTALNEAKTEEEKEAARRELKRLEEEQRQMLADADELKQRMEQQQNQSENAEQREQLDQARENMQQAAEAASQGQPSQALASGTRAQEQMEQMREELRKQSAGAFEEELRQMRADARELARKQEEIAQEMNRGQQSQESGSPDKPDPADKPRQAPSLGSEPPEDKLAEQLQQQEQRTGELVQRAQELSEQAEPSEPLLSRQIYETARQFSQSDANAVKEAQQELVREGRLSREGFDQLRELQEREQAGRALRLTNELQQQNLNREAARTGERAREGLNRLRDGIEQAAESVLGDDTEALRLAEQQLQQAAEAMQREMEQQSGQQPGEQNQQANAGGQRQPREGQQPRNGPCPNGEGEPQTAQNEPREGQSQNEPREGQPQTAQNQEREGQPREGQQPGEQEGQQPQQGQANSRQPGQRQGSGQPREGQQPGERQPGERQPGEQNEELAQDEPQEGEQQGEGQQPGEQQGQQEGQQGSEARQPGRSATSRSGQRQTAANNDGGRGGGPEEFLETARGPRDRRPAVRDPLTGEGFTDWSDSLREAEELVDQNDLRNDIAQARERARQMRLDMRKAEKKPDWAVVQLEIVKPLVEVRDRVRQELARRESDKALVPVDRDPVPAQFTENVRRYYEQLGKDQ